MRRHGANQTVPFKVLKPGAVPIHSVANHGTPKSCKNAAALFSRSTTWRISRSKAKGRLRATLHQSNCVKPKNEQRSSPCRSPIGKHVIFQQFLLTGLSLPECRFVESCHLQCLPFVLLGHSSRLRDVGDIAYGRWGSRGTAHGCRRCRMLFTNLNSFKLHGHRYPRRGQAVW
jgi:hypothetical protein